MDWMATVEVQTAEPLNQEALLDVLARLKNLGAVAGWNAGDPLVGLTFSVPARTSKAAASLACDVVLLVLPESAVTSVEIEPYPEQHPTAV